MLCDDELRESIRRNLADFDVRKAPQGDDHRAAVALLVTDVGTGPDLPGFDTPTEWCADAALMLTRRSESLRNHPGQWAFPGGRIDPGETVLGAALRELEEEVAVSLGEASVLGRLDDFVTRSGFAISPVIIWGGPHLGARRNPAEVASIHRIPLTEFCRDDAPLLDIADTSEHPILRMPVGDDYIAAPTAAMIYQFREVGLCGNAVRVAHYEQPEFAWR
jgi:8-oxo-dGTP pyrophosphatase MutT (NUDIX family)